MYESIKNQKFKVKKKQEKKTGKSDKNKVS
jgi:hypothetical protein